MARIQEAINYLEGLKEKDPDQEIFWTVWSDEDVKHVEKELGITGVTDEQRADVLWRVDHYHDANVGVNWDVIGYHLQAVVSGS